MGKGAIPCRPEKSRLYRNNNLESGRYSLRLVFFGSCDFAADILSFLANSPYRPSLVVSVIDQPYGRRQLLQPPPVKQLAEKLHIECWQLPSLKKATVRQRFMDLNLDFGLVVSYGKIIPPAILSTAKRCFLNIHPSDLPRFRGAAPIERAILTNDQTTAVCIMEMEAGLDDGAVLLRQNLPILPDMNVVELRQQLIELSCSLIQQTLSSFSALYPQRQPQSDTGIVYAHKIMATDGYVNIEQEDGQAIYNKIRALALHGGAAVSLNGQKLSIFQARFWTEHELLSPPIAWRSGEIVQVTKSEFLVYLPSGLLAVSELQLAGKKRLSTRDFLAGRSLKPGDRISSWPLEHGEK